LALLNDALESCLFMLPFADVFGLGIRWKTGRGKAGELAAEFGIVMAQLCVEGTPVRIDHLCGVRIGSQP
jgi:hypothetical protein